MCKVRFYIENSEPDASAKAEVARNDDNQAEKEDIKKQEEEANKAKEEAQKAEESAKQAQEEAKQEKEGAEKAKQDSQKMEESAKQAQEEAKQVTSKRLGLKFSKRSYSIISDNNIVNSPFDSEIFEKRNELDL